MAKELKDQPLSRPEAQRVARWLRVEKNKAVPGGWTGIHKLTPAQIAKEYQVPAAEIISEARLDIVVNE